MRTEKSLKRDPIGKERLIIQKGDIAEFNSIKRITSKPYSKDGTKHPIDLITFSTREKNIVYAVKHPTKKPVELLRYLIRTYTQENETVLDFTMGSGTTLVAAKKNGCKAIGIEIEEKYCQITTERLRQQTLMFSEAI